ncbi:thioesterase II family protein [Streptomyces sp. NPDC088812]|uniref:thioesterase II family protein n=1 Tax=Streptomyces sp. NPDC088812 TaxID=3365905 RepID=UPI0038263997
MTGIQETWLRCADPRPAAGRRLVCFPHAGGSAAFYRDWGRHLPDLEVHAVSYPGRAERIEEEPRTDLRRLAREIADALERLADRPLLLFGHSMGAVVALETARELQARGVVPAHLYASGSRNAPLPEPEADDAADEDEESLTARLLHLGGTDPGLARDPLFRELVLPYLRADGQMFRSHARDFRPLPRLDCPVTSIVGDADPDADRRPWSDLTTGTFQERTVPGGDHFYLLSDPPYDLLLRDSRDRPTS